MTLGQTIRTTRETQGLKREDLASQSGVGYWKIVRLENDNRAGRWEDIVSLARVLGLDLQELSTATPG